jgi:hypothetical protein
MVNRVLLLLFAAALSSASPAFACKCKGDKSPINLHIERFPAVFVGIARDSIAPGVFVFEVLWSYKGITTREVRSEQSFGNCAFMFQRGRAYVVYASMLGGLPSATICSRTGPIESRLDDLAILSRRKPLDLTPVP